MSTIAEVHSLVLYEAENSKANKRKVGAVLAREHTTGSWDIKATGCNYNPTGEPCEDSDGNTVPSVIHAEIAALDAVTLFADSVRLDKRYTLFVSHQPCTNCLEAIDEHGVNYKVVEDGIKYDDNKLDLTVVPSEVKIKLAEMGAERRELLIRVILSDLIPTYSLRQLQGILEYGAKKYKKGNWKLIKDHTRYVKALERHYDLGYKCGEPVDDESGFEHLAHVMCNAAFLMELARDEK